jgi:hypothetical protein
MVAPLLGDFYPKVFGVPPKDFHVCHLAGKMLDAGQDGHAGAQAPQLPRACDHPVGDRICLASVGVTLKG